MEGAPRASTRRRRLVERGSDRLAFITGQTRDLPPDPFPDSPLSSTASAQQFEGGIGTKSSQVQPSLQAKHKSHSSEGDLLLKLKASSAVPEIQPVYEPPLLRSRDDETLNKRTYDYGAVSVQPKREMEMRPRSVPPREMETRPRSVPPTQPDQTDDPSWSLETLKQLVDFTPQEITQAISATEFSRCMASILIAFMVVLSNWGLDVGGTISRVLVCTRPLLFLIITNVTIVMSLHRSPSTQERRGAQESRGASSVSAEEPHPSSSPHRSPATAGPSSAPGGPLEFPGPPRRLRRRRRRSGNVGVFAWLTPSVRSEVAGFASLARIAWRV